MSLSGNGRPDVQTPSMRAFESSGPSPDDPRVIAALEEYAAARKAGEAPDRAAFQARHPEIAAVLAQWLEGLEACEALRQRSVRRPRRPPEPDEPGFRRHS